MSKLLFIFLFFLPNYSFADFKNIKKKAEINKPEIIFPIKKDKKKCISDMYISPDINYIKPILKVEAPSGYGLDDRFDNVKSKFTDFSFPCSSGNVEACQNAKRVILEWAKADAVKRTGPSDGEGRHWNDTLTVNLYIASPMMAAYSFAKQVIDIPKVEDKIIKDWFKRIVKKNKHLMYEYSNFKCSSKKFIIIK